MIEAVLFFMYTYLSFPALAPVMLSVNQFISDAVVYYTLNPSSRLSDILIGTKKGRLRHQAKRGLTDGCSY